MEHNDPLEELWAVKEELSKEFPTASALAAEAARIAKEEHLSRPAKTRKLIPGFSRGQSVADPDPIMEEIYRAKEELAKEFGYDIHRMAEHIPREQSSSATPTSSIKKLKQRKSPSKFRMAKSKTAIRHRENGHH